VDGSVFVGLSSPEAYEKYDASTGSLDFSQSTSTYPYLEYDDSSGTLVGSLYDLVEIDQTDGSQTTIVSDVSNTNIEANQGKIIISEGENLAAYDLSTGSKEWTSSTYSNYIQSVGTNSAQVAVKVRNNGVEAVSLGTSDPSVTVDGSTVSYSGTLDSEYSESISLSTGSHTVDASASGPLDVTVEWTEVTETTDPTVEVNGNADGITGTLSDG